MKQTILSKLSQATNAYLALDPESKQRLAALKGRVIAIELLPLHFTFQCEITEDRILFHDQAIATPETTICGTPLQLMGLALAKKHRQQFFADDVTLSGNAELGQEIIGLFDALYIDWEDYLSQLIGDVPAYHTAQLLHKAATWLTNTKESFAQNINEFIHEEAPCLPSREALKDLFDDIDTLRMDVDRIEMKIKQLQNKDKP